jgi:hypothetical protein
MTTTKLRGLADHMGHDLNIHLNHYAFQLEMVERAKVAKVLSADCAVNNGYISKQLEMTELSELRFDDSWLNEGY